MAATDLPAAGANVTEALRRATLALAAHSDSPRLDAELLLGRVLHATRSALRVRACEALAGEAQRAYDALLARRAAGAPVAYLTGTREFWSLPLTVTPAVLVPRPETELLVELALARLPADAPRTVLDLGTGSGAVALGVASERPLARLTAVDVCADALAVARLNERVLVRAPPAAPAPRACVPRAFPAIDWRLGSWFDAVADARFDVVVANPPYIAAGDPALEALRAEPALALTPGPTGLEALELIIDAAPRHLAAGGWLLLEHGSDQAAAVTGLLRQRGFEQVRTFADAAQRPRVSVGTLPLSRLATSQEST